MSFQSGGCRKRAAKAEAGKKAPALYEHLQSAAPVDSSLYLSNFMRMQVFGEKEWTCRSRFSGFTDIASIPVNLDRSNGACFDPHLTQS